MDKSTCEHYSTVKKKPCDYYIKSGFCSRHDMFRCPGYIEQNEPSLSHSGIMNYIRCPRLFYYNNIKGVQSKKSQYSDPLRIGIAIDNYVTSQLLGEEIEDGKLTPNSEIEYPWQAKAIAMMRSFAKLVDTEMLSEKYTGQLKFQLQNDGYPQINGIIDLGAQDGSHFIELKSGKSPEYYTNLFYIKYKLATYFMASDDYKSGIVWVIRVPQLKRTGKFKTESLEDYSERCYRDMVARCRFYYPGYDPQKKNFGVKFSRSELDIDEMWDYYRMVADNIKLSVKRNLFMQNGTGCLHPFECDYLQICKNNGNISEDLYDFRAKELEGNG